MDESGITNDARIGGLVDERYRVLEAMASGSMGVVYKAERVPVGKLVAIKFLHAPFANDSEFLARFEEEIGLPENMLRFEIQIETPESVVRLLA